MKIALFGATGRLGRAIASLAISEISEAIAHPDSSSLGEKLGNLTIASSFQNISDILIDVSLSPQPSLNAAKQAKLPLVIGITALSPAQMSQIQEASKEIPIFYSPNFSLGMALFRKLCLDAATRFPSCTLDLFEAPHAKKKDSPSGSALHLSRELEKSGKTASIHSIRSGQIVGEHKLLLNTDEERIEIAHTAHSRDVFVRGALTAARFLQKQKPGLYGMDDLLLYSPS
jgi:4-hydroxy-tetrahydrodipicolinate reductase